MDLPSILAAFFRREAPLAPEDGLVVAFSGGPDSTALLWGLARLAAMSPLRLTAAHLDHGMDPGSAGRAAAAARIAGGLGVPLVTERREVPALREPGESAEAAARRVRYAFLKEVRARLDARWIATAHHRDDQAETVLLRLLFGSGLAGVAGIRPVHGRVVRPLLGVSRAGLAAALSAARSAGDAGVSPVEDPTNLDPRTPRNRVRHGLLPALEAAEGELSPGLARLAERARGAASALESRLAPLLAAEPLGKDGGGIAVARAALERLPSELLPFAFAALHRQAGAPYPAGGAARSEVLRQLAAGKRTGCDCGGGWRWEQRRDSGNGRLLLRRIGNGAGPTGERVADFTYTLEVPGELDIPEIAARVRLTRGPVEPWMHGGSPHRAGLVLPLTAGDHVTIRNRRPGDRLRPLGAGGSRRLKEVLIDRKVPREERDRLPLLCVGERIAWIPGITIDQRFRITEETTAWVAEVMTQ